MSLNHRILDKAEAAWRGATQAQKQKALMEATAAVDMMFRFRGGPRTKSQRLSWPRRNAFFDDGKPITGIPQELQEATSVLAKFLVASIPMNVDSMAYLLLTMKPIIVEPTEH